MEPAASTYRGTTTAIAMRGGRDAGVSRANPRVRAGRVKVQYGTRWGGGLPTYRGTTTAIAMRGGRDAGVSRANPRVRAGRVKVQYGTRWGGGGLPTYRGTTTAIAMRGGRDAGVSRANPRVRVGRVKVQYGTRWGGYQHTGGLLLSWGVGGTEMWAGQTLVWGLVVSRYSMAQSGGGASGKTLVWWRVVWRYNMKIMWNTHVQSISSAFKVMMTKMKVFNNISKFKVKVTNYGAMWKVLSQ